MLFVFKLYTMTKEEEIKKLKEELLNAANWLDKIIYDNSMFIKALAKVEVVKIKKYLGVSNTEEE